MMSGSASDARIRMNELVFETKLEEQCFTMAPPRPSVDCPWSRTPGTTLGRSPLRRLTFLDGYGRGFLYRTRPSFINLIPSFS